MNFAAISHRTTENYIYPVGRNKLVISLSGARDDLKKVSLVFWPRYATDRSQRRIVVMDRSLRDRFLDYFRATIFIDGISAYTRYVFLLENEKESIWFGKNGFEKEDNEENFFEFLWPNTTDGYRAPKWAERQIYYQIFPERFRNGDSSLTPENAVAWGSPPTRENFMGGDLKGILEKLDYIQSLGITCIYLTPIFKATSNHKYDTTDYFDIDPAFGTKEDLLQLVKHAHSRQIRILLDGVFNHCGYYWPQFQDVVKKGRQSKYKDWFFPHSFPVHERLQNYDCVGHYKCMPKINLINEEAKAYFISVGRYWIENFNIDGWRLDVADEVPTEFWEDFSEAIKASRPDALLLGETWGDAGKLVSINRLDTAMNYLFRDAAVDWLANGKIGPTELDHRLNRMLALYQDEVAKRLYNPLDSHDTARFRWLCADKRAHELAVALQMTIPGCPAVFYGDEIGLEGGNDPECRLAMEWDESKQNRELFAWYQKLIEIRKNSESLISGDFRSLVCDDESNVYGFQRSTENETSIVLMNAGAKTYRKTIKADGEWEALISGSKKYSSENGALLIELKPHSVEIFQRK